MGKLISIGEALIDRITYPDGSVEMLAGGAPANVAACVAHLGQSAFLLTKLGEDDEGTHLYNKLASMNVDVRYVLRTSTHRTTVAQVTIDAQGDRHFQFDRRNASDLFFTRDDMPTDLLEPSDIFHFGSVDLVPSLMKEATIQGIMETKRQGALLSFDPNLRFALWPSEDALRATVLEHMIGVDILKVTEEELTFLFPNQSLPDQISACFAAKVTVVLVSKGDKGVSLYTESGFEHHERAHHVKVIDTTGAGDGLMAGFLYALLVNQESRDDLLHNGPLLIKSLRFGNAVAALVCTKKGAIPAFPSEPDVQKFITSKEK